MNAPQDAVIAHADPLVIAGRAYRSRLLVGTGKYKDFRETRAAIDASGAEIVTVAIRRTNIGQNPDEPSLLDRLPPSEFTLLPNTAGCYTAEDAIRTLKLGRELLDGHKLAKLEVLGDPHTLFPNVRETLRAAEILVKDGFDQPAALHRTVRLGADLGELGIGHRRRQRKRRGESSDARERANAAHEASADQAGRGRARTRGIELARHAARTEGLAAGLDGFFHRAGHQHGIFRERDACVHEDARAAELHRDRRVGRGAHAGVDQHWNFRRLDDELQVPRVEDAHAGAD